MNKREFLLEKIKNIEPILKIYYQNFENRIKRAFIVKEKAIIKIWSIFLKEIFGISYLKKIKTFFDREMHVYLEDADASSLYFFGILFGYGYGTELSLIKYLIKNIKENDVFYDIGANYGFYTILAQEFISSGEIHSFEPNPSIFPLLVENAQPEKFSNTFLNEVALSNKDEELEFYDRFNQRHSGGSSLIKYSHFEGNYKSIKVRAMKLDTYLLSHKKPTIMKVDIEGGEPLFLKGAENFLKENNPVIIIEIVPDELHKQAVEILQSFGYKMYAINEEGEVEMLNNNQVNEVLSGKINLGGNFFFKK